jgi:hypothetical protein
MLNLLIGCVFIIAGIDMFLHPVYHSYKCGGCEIDLRPFHYFIGPIIAGIGAYFIYSKISKKSSNR